MIGVILSIAAVIALNEPPQRTNAEFNLNKQGAATIAQVAQAEPQQERKAATPQQVVQAKAVEQQSLEPKPQPAPVKPKTNREVGQEKAASKGWTGDQWLCLEKLWTNESNWNHDASNRSSGAYGIAQALPASKMAPYGEDYLTNPATQIDFGLEYIDSRYGTPCAALSFWNSNSPHWY